MLRRVNRTSKARDKRSTACTGSCLGQVTSSYLVNVLDAYILLHPMRALLFEQHIAQNLSRRVAYKVQRNIHTGIITDLHTRNLKGTTAYCRSVFSILELPAPVGGQTRCPRHVTVRTRTEYHSYHERHVRRHHRECARRRGVQPSYPAQ